MISILIPTYNERENIPLLFEELDAALKNQKEPYEFIVIDDNSPDKTAEAAQNLSKVYPSRVLIRTQKSGLASAIMKGVKAAKGDKLVIIDADLSHPPELVPTLVLELKTFDLVIGSRHLPGGGVASWTTSRKLISDGATALARVIIGTNVTDPMSGFFAIKKSILEKTKLKVKGYKILLNILAQHNLKITEVPYFFKDRKFGKTKLDSKEMANYVVDLLRLKFS